MEQVKNIKILLIRRVNPFFDASASGNRFSSLISGLTALGAEITVLVTEGYNNPSEKKLSKQKTDYQNISFKYITSTYNHTIWHRRINRYILFRLLRNCLIRRIKKEMRLYNGNYVWIAKESINLASFLEIYKELHCYSFIELNEFHDNYKISGKTTNKLQLKQAKVSEKIFLEAIKNIDCFAIMTETLLKYYKSMAKQDAVFIHLPMTVDMSRFNISKNPDLKEKYIAFAGAFENNKDGLHILIESFGKIHAKYPEYRLKIAGFYHPDIEKQKQIITQYNIQDKVQYMGVLDRKQIPQFLINASILALARPDSHQAQGGFPTKLGEYLATKNPVCVTTTGEIGNYLTDNVSAFMAIPGDVDSFADALDRAMRDDGNAIKVGLAGYEVARKNFDKDVQARRLYDFLCNNLKKK